MPMHVVLFETDPSVARMISCRLMRAEFEVHSACDVDSAWDVIQRVGPQLLVTDLQPSSVELVRRVRQAPETSRLPIIGLSPANLSPADEDALRHEWDLAAVVSKPFSIRRLVRLAWEAMHGGLSVSPAV